MPERKEGIISAVIEETFEPMHTGVSLVFTIAPNGHVWGKRFDYDSGKNDIELELFTPYLGGYHIFKGVGRECFLAGGDITRLQESKVKAILAQKDSINYLLGTIMIPGYVALDSRWIPIGSKRCRKLYPREGAWSIKVVDLYKENHSISSLEFFQFSYDYVSCSFTLTTSNTKIHIYEGEEKSPGSDVIPQSARVASKPLQAGYFWGKANFPRVEFFAVRAFHANFDMRQCAAHNARKLIGPRLKIMYGEYDFFEYFSVDDALLLLEEKRLSETDSELYFTLVIIQHKLARELVRLRSNNPYVFDGLM